jgi:copper(I)-binding protein
MVKQIFVGMIGVAGLFLAGCASAEEATPSASSAPQQPSVTISEAYVAKQRQAAPFLGMTITANADDSISRVSTVQDEALFLTEPVSVATPTAPPTGRPPAFSPGEEVSEVEVQAGEPLVFGPGGYGAFLDDESLKTGEALNFQITFERAGVVRLSAVVR